ncbi:MAG: SDR family NAD(P)-dependent oxidoreductase [Planctomycetota bacterium]|nr:SDR family NAD(P)-dependent oxidoreductase [Planctomycetota bacterium]
MKQVAVITGASSGIGEALAKQLAQDGYAVGLTARRADRLEALADAIRGTGGTAAVAPADVADREAHIAAIHALAEALGPVDLLVANAGVGISEPVRTPNAADYEAMVRVNLLGPYYGVEAVLPSMLERGRGHLVAISSLGSYVSGPGAGQYCATKAGLSSWMESIRLELRGSGVHVTTINPGFIETPMTDQNDFDMPLLMSPERAARLMARAIRKKKKVYDFPWRLRQAIRLVRILPDAIKVKLMRSPEDA